MVRVTRVGDFDDGITQTMGKAALPAVPTSLSEPALSLPRPGQDAATDWTATVVTSVLDLFASAVGMLVDFGERHLNAEWVLYAVVALLIVRVARRRWRRRKADPGDIDTSLTNEDRSHGQDNSALSDDEPSSVESFHSDPDNLSEDDSDADDPFTRDPPHLTQ